MSLALQVLVADDNPDFCRQVGDCIEAEADLTLAGVAYDGKQVLEQVHEVKPDIVVLDVVMPKLDGLGVLEALQGEEDKPKIIMLSAFGQETLVAKALALGADYFVMKPFDMPTLMLRLRQLGRPAQATESLRQDQRRHRLEREVNRYMSRLGVPPHYKGYLYLREAIALVVEDVELLTRVTKGLYPAIAERHNTTACKVERAIRHAVEATWTRGNINIINELFQYTVNEEKGKPTNSSFIARLADQVRMDLRAG